MTQMSEAKKGNLTEEMRAVAKQEGVGEEFIREGLAEGRIVIPANLQRRGIKICGIGEGLRTKVNANIGASQDEAILDDELRKMNVAREAGADTLMDLSTSGNLTEIRRAILAETPLPLGTVPIYQVAVETAKNKKSIVEMKEEDIFRAIEQQAEEGVDFMTLHCGITRETLERFRRQGRIADVVSRGGAFLIAWMIHNGRENPLYENYGRVLKIAKKFDITLSLGDGMRPGSIADATDRAQIQELILLGELAKEAWGEDVQVMIEGPGHIPLNEVETNVLLEKKLCQGAPFYVLGPLVTDIAPGYDHIVAAIGGAVAAAAGADFLCYVTPSEHLRLPTVEDVQEGVIVTRIAAHAADIAKGIKGASDRDLKISRKRKSREWDKQMELALHPEKARRYREESKPKTNDVCTMCGEYCALKIVDE
ncbi:phosphomethylpyrimidine synthase ThiC, partial [candidate division NPL-UPA2 bacterium]|nr:phosphomethylpyrimidine synthase ThiC [candidate division NPL-UPA2 bacterium]